MYSHEPREIGGMGGITPAVKFLLILNISIYLIELIFRLPLRQAFLLDADWYLTWRFGQLFTYMFIHSGIMHLLANMIGLFFIGPSVEKTIGSYRFFILYYISGIIGGLAWSIFADPNGLPCGGASGAVMGILGAFAALYPNAQLLLWFVIPVRAWVVVLLLAVWELHEIIGNPFVGGVANMAHLAGGIAGLSYALILKKPYLIQQLKNRLPGFAKKKPAPRVKTSAPPTLSKEEVDAILDKIGKEGMGALTPREREMLKRATRG